MQAASSTVRAPPPACAGPSPWQAPSRWSSRRRPAAPDQNVGALATHVGATSPGGGTSTPAMTTSETPAEVPSSTPPTTPAVTTPPATPSHTATAEPPAPTKPVPPPVDRAAPRRLRPEGAFPAGAAASDRLVRGRRRRPLRVDDHRRGARLPGQARFRGHRHRSTSPPGTGSSP